MRLDAFLKLETQTGESTDTLHDKEIEILSFEQTTSRYRKDSNDTGTWAFNLSVVTIIKPLDASSPRLMEAVTQSAKTFSKATISVCRMKGDSTQSPDKWKKIDYFTIVLTDVYITRIQLIGDARIRSFGGDEIHRFYPEDLSAIGPLEQVDLNYKKMTWTYIGGEDQTTKILSVPVERK